MTRTVIALLLVCVTSATFAQSADRQKFAEWTVDCRVDAMTDVKTCLILSSPAHLVVAIKNGDLEVIMVGRKHDPGSQVMLRLDAEPPLTAAAPGFTGRTASTILERLPKAQRIPTRYIEWPSKRVDGEFSPNGFSEAVQFAVATSKSGASAK